MNCRRCLLSREVSEWSPSVACNPTALTHYNESYRRGACRSFVVTFGVPFAYAAPGVVCGCSTSTSRLGHRNVKRRRSDHTASR